MCQVAIVVLIYFMMRTSVITGSDVNDFLVYVITILL